MCVLLFFVTCVYRDARFRECKVCFSLILRLNITFSSMNVSTIIPHILPLLMQVRDAYAVFVLQAYSLRFFRFSYRRIRLLFLLDLPRSSVLIPFLHETVAFWYRLNFYKMRCSLAYTSNFAHSGIWLFQNTRRSPF